MIGGYGVGSSRQELNRAEAIAVDLGSLEDRGREEVGDLHAILRILNDANQRVQRCLDIRVIRKVTGEDSPWKREGDIVDTTAYDRQFVAMRAFAGENMRGSNHWYLSEGVSPGVLVMERSSRPGVVTPDPFSVTKTLRDAMRDREGEANDMAWVLFEEGLLLMQPSVALPRTQMKPAEIIAHMKDRGAVAAEGRMTFSRDGGVRGEY